LKIDHEGRPDGWSTQIDPVRGCWLIGSDEIIGEALHGEAAI
jgi:hypothetical protein